MYRRILVPLDGSAFAEAALPYALSLASRWKSALELATVASVPPAGASDYPQEDTLERLRRYGRYGTEYLAAIEGRIRDTGFDGEIHKEVISAGNVPHSLIHHASEREVDFAVMTTHGRGPLERAWLGSSADGFVRRSHIPVLLVRPDEEERSPELVQDTSLFRRILVPLDGSETAEQALGKALPLASQEGTELVLVRVVLDPSLPGDSPYLPHVIQETKEHHEVETAARQYLERVAARIGDADTTAVPRARVITAPAAAAAILDAMGEEQVDLVALTTAGRGGAARLLLGSVADKVVRSSPVPVLVYRTPETA